LSIGYSIRVSNPTPRTRTITIRRGTPLSDDRRIRAKEDVSVRVPAYNWMNVAFDEKGDPHQNMVRTIEDINIERELNPFSRISFTEQRRIRSRIDGVNHRDMSNEKTRDKFTEASHRVYHDIHHAPENYLGGRMLLAQTSLLRSQRDKKPGLYSPAALNMSVWNNSQSLYNLVKQGNLEIIECIGDGFNSDDAIQLKIQNKSTQRVRFNVPKGMMFEQSSWTGNQNLVVPDEQWFEIGPGEEQNFPVPALCANATGGGPNRNRMNLTPFVMNDLGNSFTDQENMWRTTDGRERRARL